MVPAHIRALPVSSEDHKLVVDRIDRVFYLRWDRYGADPRLTRAARFAIGRSRLSTGRSVDGYYTFRTRKIADQALIVANAAVEEHRLRLLLA